MFVHIEAQIPKANNTKYTIVFIPIIMTNTIIQNQHKFISHKNNNNKRYRNKTKENLKMENGIQGQVVPCVAGWWFVIYWRGSVMMATHTRPFHLSKIANLNPCIHFDKKKKTQPKELENLSCETQKIQTKHSSQLTRFIHFRKS